VEVAGKAINGGHIAKRGAREGTVSVESSRPDRCEGDNWLISLPFICFSFFFVCRQANKAICSEKAKRKRPDAPRNEEAARDQTRRRNGPSNGGQRV
jgi:hypothetical protein